MMEWIYNFPILSKLTTIYKLSSIWTHLIVLSWPYKIKDGVVKKEIYFSFERIAFHMVTLLSLAPKHRIFNLGEYDKQVTLFLCNLILWQI